MKELDTATERRVEPRLHSWPSPQDYNEAIQNPHLAFGDPQLASAEAELNVIGLPKPASGNFASVYRMFSGEGEWAVRCFLQPMSDQQERYSALSKKLADLNLPYLVGFEFLPEGIRVHNNWFPMIKMQWVKGTSLLEYLQANLKDADALHRLAGSFREMIISLRDSGIAHGDLQHGNILVEENGQLRLVDYDGCFVPELAGRISNELGHRNYQHPKRSPSNFDEHVDTFSARLICLSLKALADDPSLWERLQAGDECLLFRRQDLIAPEYSRAFHLLELHHNEDIRQEARALRSALKQEPHDLVPFDHEASIANDLPPLSAILEIKTFPVGGLSQSSSTGMNSSARKRARTFLGKYPKKWGDLITGLALCSAACIFVSLSQWAASSVSHKFNVSWTQDSKQRAEELDKVNKMLSESEDGEEFYLPRRLLQQAELARYSDKHRAELNFQHAIDLSGENRFCTLSNEELANAYEYVGLQKSERNQGDYGVSYLENSFKLYNAIGNKRRAVFVLNELGDAALKAGSYYKAFDSYLNCLVDYQYGSRRSPHMLTHYAAESALKIFGANDGLVKGTSNLQTLWNVIRRYQDSEVMKIELSEIYSYAAQLISDKKFEDAITLFSLQRDLASQRGDLKEYENYAANQLEEIAKLQAEAKKQELSREQERERERDGERERERRRERALEREREQARERNQSSLQTGSQYLMDNQTNARSAQKPRLPRPEANSK